MERKSLGRALEDISSLFLSSVAADPKAVDTGFWSIGVRDETCASCAHFIEGPDKAPKCKIFSVENEKFGVPHLSTITYGHGRYCKYYTKGREGLPQKEPAPASEAQNPPKPDFELEEAVSVTRKMAYPDSESGQRGMKEVLFKYLQEGYEIRRVELRKRNRISQPGRRETRDEEISVFIKQNGAS